MANTFSLILVIVTLVTGIVWTLEKLVWAKKTPTETSSFTGANARYASLSAG